MKRILLIMVALVISGCVTTSPPPQKPVRERPPRTVIVSNVDSNLVKIPKGKRALISFNTVSTCISGQSFDPMYGRYNIEMREFDGVWTHIWSNLEPTGTNVTQYEKKTSDLEGLYQARIQCCLPSVHSVTDTVTVESDTSSATRVITCVGCSAWAESDWFLIESEQTIPDTVYIRVLPNKPEEILIIKKPEI